MKYFVTLFIFFLTLGVFAQDVRIEEIKYTDSEYTEWGFDKTILNNEAVGQFSGVQTSNQTVYVAVNDTISTANLGLLILTSTNDGDNWSVFPQGITYRGSYEKIKVIRSGLDSVYCVFQVQGQIYLWNFLSGALNILANEPYRTFDVAATSTGNIHIMVDVLASNTIRRFGSTNGGATWATTAVVTSAGAMPKLTISGTGDTLILNYYGPVLADTANSIIRAARYVQTTPGQLASSGFQDVVTDNVPKHEFMSVINNSEVYFLYTTGAPGSRDIMYRKSINNGTSYGAAEAFANNPNVDEYGVDGGYYMTSNFSGFDFVFYRDSAQTGNPTNESDGVYYRSVAFGSTSFSANERVSDNPPTYSENYSPKIVSLNFSTADVGIIWVGDNKTLWDRLTAVIPVELVSFTANVSGNNVILNWSTASETNNFGFEIQRTIKNEKLQITNWEKVGFVNGIGTSSEFNNYSFVDNNIQSGKYSYRLKQIDFDGSVEYSNLIEVEIGLPQEFALLQNYPNPFNPSTEIRYQISEDRKVSLKVFDILGNEVATLVNEFKSAGSYNVNFDASKLSSGIYYYTLRAGEFVQTKKMLLLK